MWHLLMSFTSEGSAFKLLDETANDPEVTRKFYRIVEVNQ